MKAERGDGNSPDKSQTDRVLVNALGVLHQPDMCGYWAEDCSYLARLPGAEGDLTTIGNSGLHMVHVVVALPPDPLQLVHSDKNVPHRLPIHEFVRQPHVDEGKVDEHRRMFRTLLSSMYGRVYGELGEMTSREYLECIDVASNLDQKEPLAIYALLAEDSYGIGVLQPSVARIYVPYGYSVALAMRDVATLHGVSMSLN